MAETRSVPLWVVTGPIAGGKSSVTALLAERGARVIDADLVGHDVLGDAGVVDELVCAFGSGILQQGRIERAALGRIVFADAVALARLESVVHPLLSARLQELLAGIGLLVPPPPLAVVEAAVYFRLPPFGSVDLVILVTAEPELRLKRLTTSGPYADAEARRRIEAQRPLLKDWRRPDIVLHNEGTPDELRQAVTALWSEHLNGS